RETREFFARGGRPHRAGPPLELPAYLCALSSLVEERHLAVDLGTGDGALLEMLAPIFEVVVAVDRSAEQLDLARSRVQRREFTNVTLVHGEIDGPEVARAVSRASGADRGADAVFAARVLHHAAAPRKTLAGIVRLARPATSNRVGGAVSILDY